MVKRDRNAETEQEDKKTTEGSELFSVDREKVNLMSSVRVWFIAIHILDVSIFIKSIL